MSSPELIGSAFVMGLAGSLHCIGMCGPLALSLPLSHTSRSSRIFGGFIYNSGRISSYIFMGSVFGLLGNIVIAARWQSALSIALGILVLLYLIVPKKYFHFPGVKALNKPLTSLRRLIGTMLHSGRGSSVFFIGVLNGFLPCGLVYLALTSSVIAASPLKGGLFMLFFGLGTFPLMYATVLMGNHLNQSVRRRIYKAVPVLLFLMATLLILRGMNLGIPFLSPGFNSEQTKAVECH